MRRELIYAAAVGGCVGALMTMALGLVLPLGAQSQSNGTFGKITCTELDVLRPNGTHGASIRAHDKMVFFNMGRLFDAGVFLYAGVDGANVKVMGNGKGESTKLGVSDKKGYVRVVDENGNAVAGMSADENGGIVGVGGKGDNSANAVMNISKDNSGGQIIVFRKANSVAAALGTSDSGGTVRVFGRDGTTKGLMAVSDETGMVSVFANDNEPEALMTIDNYGGTFAVYGRGNDELRAVMGVSEYGTGVVNTWDKNGYRIATLK